jgi:hypothetical protein
MWREARAASKGDPEAEAATRKREEVGSAAPRAPCHDGGVDDEDASCSVMRLVGALERLRVSPQHRATALPVLECRV